MNGSISRRPLRILCISPLFVPLANPEAFCGAKMAKALLDEGVDLRVLHDPRYLDLPDVRRDTSDIWECLKGVTVETEPVSRDLLDGICSFIRYRAYARWAPVAVRRALSLHTEFPFDLVYSRSLPFQGHVVGYWCARTLGLPWVANINDPWDIRFSPVKGEEPPSAFRAVLSTYWLRKTLRSADLVTFPCRRLAVHTTRRVRHARPFEVIPHVGLSAPAEPDPGIFRLLHAGLLGLRYGRSAEGLLQGLRKFLDRRPEARPTTRLTLIGPDVPETRVHAEAAGVGGNVESTGGVAYVESLRWISRASVCVLIEADVPEGIFLPSKLVDYLSARKPVLALSPAVGTVVDMLPNPAVLRVSVKDSDGIAGALGVLYDDYKNGTLDRRCPSEQLVRRFEAGVVVKQFLAAVEKAGISRHGG